LNISPSEPLWIELAELLETHAEQIARFGGSLGIRDQKLIESALERPKSLFHYGEEEDLLNLAVRLGVGIAKNHGFIDGNKRTGALAMIEFLALNGFALDLPNDTTFGVLFDAAVAGRMTEDELAEDLYSFVHPIEAD
jgi:death-on-curing protein